MVPHMFEFGFEGDDIEEDSPEGVQMNNKVHEDSGISEESSQRDPEMRTLDYMLSTLPSRISYTFVDIETQNGKKISLPRRELFDIRAQLMAEDGDSEEPSVVGLSTDDITPHIYEGGFKTWECSIDLARYLAGQADIANNIGYQEWHVVELGAGTALPSLVLLKALSNFDQSKSSGRAAFCLTLADYNNCVLQLATMPNIVLTRVLGSSKAVAARFGDLEISPTVLQNFKDDLSKHNIHISTISGAWGPKFIDSVKSEALPILSSSLCLDRRPETLILASETIYSPSTIACFVSTLLGLLAAAEDQGRTAKALIAAKKVYFGIGGGVDEFLDILQKNGGQAKMVWELEGEGVDRVILEVTRSALG